MITELLRHFPRDTDPAVVADLVVSYIEQSLPSILQEVSLPKTMSPTQRSTERNRLRGKHGYRQVPKSARPLIQAKLDQADRVDAFWNVRNQIKQASLPTASATLGPAFTVPIDASAAPSVMRREIRDFTETFLPVRSHSFTGNRTAWNPRQDSTAELSESTVRDIQASSFLGRLSGADARGKFALIQKGRLIEFVDVKLASADLLPGTQQIEVPIQDLYKKLDLTALMKAYSRLAQGQPLSSSLSRVTEARLIDALVAALELEEQWGVLNRHRLYLITKRHTAGLRAGENRELERLQDVARERANRIAPRPLSTVEFLKDYVQKAGLSDEV